MADDILKNKMFVVERLNNIENTLTAITNPEISKEEKVEMIKKAKRQVNTLRQYLIFNQKNLC